MESVVESLFPLIDKVSYICTTESSAFAATLDSLDKARTSFFSNGEIPPTVRAEIAESWRRCKKAGMSEAREKLLYLEGSELDWLLKRNRFLINVASPVIRYVYENLTSASCLCIIYITDNEGVVLECLHSDALDDILASTGLRVGAKWQEATVGTNAISLALRHNRTFRTYAPEHYLAAHTLINCVSALIHNNDGEVVGTITLSYYREYCNDFLLAILSTAARLIENELLNMRYLGIVNYVLNDASEGVLILDSKLRVIQTNKKLLQLIKEGSSQATSIDIKMLFKDLDFEAIARGEEIHVEAKETFLSYKNVCIRVKIDVYRIDTYGTADGYVVICRDIGDIISLSQQFVGTPGNYRFETIVTQDPCMRRLIGECKRVAANKCPILLEGESGTGKEVFAQSIHNASDRAAGPFIAVNCAALPIDLVESELFGYEKGAFTDGLATGRAGKFELANGGTIFLDEIGELPLDVQAKLLRVLDNYRITRIGGKTEKALDVRILAATNRDLFAQVQNKDFREDLYYRINVMNFRLPSLDQRRGDIPLLISHFIDRLNIENRGISKCMGADCVSTLCARRWKGNVRELQNIVTRAYYLCNDLTITGAYLPADFAEPAPESIAENGPLTRSGMEREVMRRALDMNRGAVALAAEQAGMSRATFYRKMKEYRLRA